MNAKEPGTIGKIDKYQILEELGRGGMGCVYKAFDPQMGKYVALKVLFAGKDQEQRFLRETQAMAKLKHPNIAEIYVTGQDRNSIFFTMEYIAKGCSLKEFLKSREFDIRLFLEIMVKIGKAVAYAHQENVIHRDLNPKNILIGKNKEPYVVDFGLAKLANVEKSLTKEGAILGTPRYMSPEQAQGKKVNHLTDVYALGAILYEMLATTPLVPGKKPAQIIFNVIHKDPIPLKQRNNKFSKDLEVICHKTVAKEIENRYQSAQDFVEDIERFLNGEVIKAKAFSKWEKAWKNIYKNKLAMVSSILGVLFVIAGVWVFEKRQNLQVYQYLAKAEKRKQKATHYKIGKKMEVYMEISNLLEKALEISPQNFTIREKLIEIQKAMGMLAKEQKNYLLSFTLFNQCKNLGDKKAEKLLNQLEQEKKQLQEKHNAFIAKIMKSQTLPQEELIDRYVFAIVKMKKPYIVKALIPYIKTGNKWQKLLAIKALGKFGNTYTQFEGKDSVEWLLERLALFQNKKIINDNQEEIEEIIWALGWLKDKRANRPVYELRWLVGQGRLLWNRTIIPYKWIPFDYQHIIETPQQLVTLGIMKREKGNFRGAIADFSKAIALDSKFSFAYNNRGNVYKDMKQYVKAIRDFSKAIEANPKFSLAYNNRGNVYYRRKEYFKAMADYDKAIFFAPRSSKAYNNRGNVYREIKKYARAIADFNKTIELSPRSSKAYNNRGNVYREIKEYTKAIEDFDKALILNPRFSQVYSNRGNVYREVKKYKKAIADYSRCIDLNPQFIQSYANRGSVYLDLQQYKKSYQDFQMFLKLAPNHFVAPRIRLIVNKLEKGYLK